MIWFLIGVSPLVVVYIYGFVKDPKAMLAATGFVIVLVGCVFAIVYGAYDMGWILECGGDSIWTAYDCPK